MGRVKPLNKLINLKNLSRAKKVSSSFRTIGHADYCNVTATIDNENSSFA
jgi:hypothetical protein